MISAIVSGSAGSAVALAGTATEAGSAHVADLASAYAEEHGVDYFDALIQAEGTTTDTGG